MPNKSKLLIILFIASFCFSKTTCAQQLLGADISYQHKDTSRYIIHLNLYRACQATALSDSLFCYLATNKASHKGSIKFKRDSIYNNSSFCVSGSSPCSPQNTLGTAVGMEVHHFLAEINFSDTLFRNWSNAGACSFYIGYSICCKYSAYPMVDDTIVHLFTEINLCALRACRDTFNNGIAFSDPPFNYLNVNTPFRTNFGGTEKDGDSLDFSSYNSRSSIHTFFCDNVTAYYPSAYVSCISIPQNNPPIGTYFDRTNGDFVITPVVKDEVGDLEVRLNEYRKDSSGNYLLIGKANRFMRLIVDSFNKNNPPIIKGPFSYSICEGQQLCFDIVTKDDSVSLPSPAVSPMPDSTFLIWSNNIKGATLVYKDSTAREKVGQFCWTPTIGDARSLPYTITVTVSDSACPHFEKSSFTIGINVKKMAQVDSIRINKMACGRVAFAGYGKSNGGIARYSWKILNMKDSIIYSSLKSQDSFLFNKKGGEYIFEFSLNNAYSCPDIKRDTVNIPAYLSLVSFLDTMACQSDSLVFKSKLSNAQGKVNHLWIINGNTIGVADSLVFKVNNVQQIFYKAIDSLGCAVFDTFSVGAYFPFVPNLGKDKRICPYDSSFFGIVNDTSMKYLWSTGDTISVIKALKTPGYYSLAVTNKYGCIGFDSTMLFVNKPVVANAGKDTNVCFNNSYLLSSSANVYSSVSYQYQWHVESSGQLIAAQQAYPVLITQDSSFVLKLLQIEGGLICSNYDTIQLKIQLPDTLNLKQSASYCYSDSLVDLNFASGIKHTHNFWKLIGFNFYGPGTSAFIEAEKQLIDSSYLQIFYKPGVYELRAENWESGCLAKDSFQLIVQPEPSLLLTELDTICYGDKINLTPRSQPSLSLSPSKWSGTGVLGDTFYSQLAIPNLVNRVHYGPIKIYAFYEDPTTKCSTKDSIDVVIKAAPKLQITNSNPSAICEYENIAVNVVGQRLQGSVEWFALGDGIFNNKTQTYSTYFLGNSDKFLGSTKIGVTSKNIGLFCGADTQWLDVKINSKPKLVVNVIDTTGCVPLDVLFIAGDTNANTYNYLWQTIDKQTSNKQKAIFTYKNPGKYLATLRVEDKVTKCVNEYISDTIRVYENPAASFETFGITSQILATPSFEMQNNSTILSGYIKNLIWEFGDGSSITGENYVKYTFPQLVAGYKVKLTAFSDKGCEDDTSILYTIVNEDYMFYPNAFTPNPGGSSENDVFRIRAIGFKYFEMKIFSRWGELLYESDDAVNNGWDGNSGGKLCQQGAYLLIVKTTNMSGVAEIAQKSIILIR